MRPARLVTLLALVLLLLPVAPDRPASAQGAAYARVDGVVFNDLNGDGAQDAGEPGAASVEVLLMEAGSTAGWDYSDADGTYSFQYLDSGTYQVQVQAPYNWVVTTDEQVSVVVDEGAAIVGPALGVLQADATIGDQVWHDDDSDGLVDSSEYGGVSTTVTLLADGLVVDEQLSDAHWYGYGFTGLRAGRYEVRIDVPPGYVATTPTTLQVELRAGEDYAAADFGLRRLTSAISVTTFDDVDGDGVRGAQEAPLGNVALQLRQDGSTVDYAYSDSSGQAEFIDTGAGTFAVAATAPYLYESTFADEPGVTVEEGESAALELGFVRVDAAIGDQIFLDADEDGVVDLTDGAVEGVEVRLMLGAQTLESTRSDYFGYRFDGLRPGRYRVEITVPQGFRASTPTSVTVDLDPGEVFNGGDFGLIRSGAGTSRRVGDDRDPIRAAVGVSQETFADGEAHRVVLGRDDVFADSLAGAALAGTDGPVLFTRGGVDSDVDGEALAELQRVLGPAMGCSDGVAVYLLGGEQAVSRRVEDRLRNLGYCVERLAGASRYETSVLVADVVRTLHRSSQVLLARGDSWADAITGGAYAAAAGSPILVTDTSNLHPAVTAYLASAAPSDVVLLGGPAALSPEVEIAAARLAPVRRLDGSARDATAARVLSDLWVRSGRAPTGVTLINGYDDQGWAYALAGSVLSAREEAAELVVGIDGIPAGTAALLRGYPYEFAVSVGGPDLVPAAVHEAVVAGDIPAPAPAPAPVPAPAPAPPPPAPAPSPAPAPAPPAPAPAPPPASSCDSAYPSVCIPPGPPEGPDLDCPEISHEDFTVLPADPHGFDGDDDGTGCES